MAINFERPVLQQLLRTRADVDDVIAKLRRYVPGQQGDGRQFLHLGIWWWEEDRTLSQHNLAQAWCGILALHAGCDHKEMWASLCEQLLGTVEYRDPITGESRITYKSSKTLGSKVAYGQFLNGIERIAQEHFDVQLPSRNDPRVWAAYRQLKRVMSEQTKPQRRHAA